MSDIFENSMRGVTWGNVAPVTAAPGPRQPDEVEAAEIAELVELLSMCSGDWEEIATALHLVGVRPPSAFRPAAPSAQPDEGIRGQLRRARDRADALPPRARPTVTHPAQPVRDTEEN